MERRLDFAKGKKKQPVVIGGNSQRSQTKDVVQKPPPSTKSTEWFRKFHKGHPQGK